MTITQDIQLHDQHTVCEDQKLSARNGGASYNLYKLRSESRKAEYRVTSHGSVSTSEVIPDGVLLECKVCPQSRNKNLIQTTCALWFCDTGYVRTRKHKNYQFTRILNLSTDACTPGVSRLQYIQILKLLSTT
ncbi:hypothetical protein RB195_023906 [Necator americanus]|uniref:Uncharacterized protein n=1 Tax=Necator americanus TaxID=51031 RepID=A0ABR1ELW7_NECAM